MPLFAYHACVASNKDRVNECSLCAYGGRVRRFTIFEPHQVSPQVCGRALSDVGWQLLALHVAQLRSWCFCLPARSPMCGRAAGRRCLRHCDCSLLSACFAIFFFSSSRCTMAPYGSHRLTRETDRRLPSRPVARPRVGDTGGRTGAWGTTRPTGRATGRADRRCSVRSGIFLHFRILPHIRRAQLT